MNKYEESKIKARIALKQVEFIECWIACRIGEILLPEITKTFIKNEQHYIY